MKISVITVCFNCERTIENTIKSVINQDYKDIEYIVIDGASTDNTLKIINKHDYKISKIISEKDVGIYDAINKGINVASGEILSLLHGNDIFADNQVLSKVASYFFKNKDCLIKLSSFSKLLAPMIHLSNSFLFETLNLWLFNQEPLPLLAQ